MLLVILTSSQISSAAARGCFGLCERCSVRAVPGERQAHARAAQMANTAQDSANEIFVYLAFGTVAFRKAHQDSLD